MDLRRWKGVLLFCTFTGMAISIVLQPSIGTMQQFNEVGLSNGTVGAFFFASAIFNLIIGWHGTKWNAMGQAIFHAYTIAAWASALLRPGTIPGAAVFAYTLLSGMLLLDLVHDIRRN